ncbi:MAG: amidohydrolase [Anaerolineaceae bacterium]|nr:amidohydrolase [Anaerolineaceae bacterium]
MTTILLENVTILALGHADRVYDPGFVLVEDGRIAAVGPRSRAPAGSFDERVDGAGALVMPGLVNAHTHTPMTLFRGMAEGVSLFTMEGWYETIRKLEMVMTPDMVPAAVEVACAEMIMSGTTTFADQYFHMDRIVPVVRRSGMRAALAYGVVELGDAAAREQELAQLEAFLESIGEDNSGRLQGWVGPHAFFVDNSPELMKAELGLARKYDTGLHIHLSTSGEEDRFCRVEFGRTAVQQLEAMGMLDRPLLAAHSICIPPEDWPLLAVRPFTAVIAASACMRAGAEAAPLVAMRAAGINTALGTDNVCNNNDYDLFSEMRTLAKLTSFRERRPGAIRAREALDMATRGGAVALGLGDEIGELAPGRRADLIVIGRRGPGWAPGTGADPFTALVYSVNGSQVRDVMVDGRWLMRERQLLTLDYGAAVAQLNADARRLQTRCLESPGSPAA